MTIVTKEFIGTELGIKITKVLNNLEIETIKKELAEKECRKRSISVARNNIKNLYSQLLICMSALTYITNQKYEYIRNDQEYGLITGDKHCPQIIIKRKEDQHAI